MRIVFTLLLLVSILAIPIEGFPQMTNTIAGHVKRDHTTLTVTGSGAGTGTITSVPAYINCTSTAGTESGTCSSTPLVGEVIVLTATPDASSMFNGWSGGGCSGVGTCTLTMSGTTVTVDAAFINAPLSSFLIGWYKFDEGSGVVAANSATDGSTGGGLLPNLTVTNPAPANFWTFLSGFGSVPTDAGNVWASVDLGATRNYGGNANGFATYGGFYQLKPAAASARFTGALVSLFNVNADVVGTGTEIDVDSAFVNPFTNLRGDFGWAGDTSVTSYGDMTPSNWYFLFVSNNGRMKIVRPDGTLITAAAGAIMNAVVNLQFIHVGVRYDSAGQGIYGVMGSFGDIIVYNFTRLTDSQWATWYDQLRSRYGMAARSGW